MPPVDPFEDPNAGAPNAPSDTVYPPGDPHSPPVPKTYADFQRDYWAPDRQDVLDRIALGKFTDNPVDMGDGNLSNGQPKPQASAPSTSGAPASRTGPTTYQSMEGVEAGKLNDAGVTSEKYIAARILASGGTLAQAAAAIGATVLDGTRMRLRDGSVIDTRRDEEGANALQWLRQGGTGPQAAANHAAAARAAASGGGNGAPTYSGLNTIANGTGISTTGTGPVSNNSNVFSDPATTEWESILRSLVDKLNTAQPTWNNNQLDLQQTQALDPIERQRTASKQQAQIQLASHGIAPGSGIFEQAMADIDKQFNQLRTTTQANFATQAINRDDTVFQNNETRATNAAGLMKQIPQLADQRLATAQGTMMSVNPAQLLGLQSQIENAAQDQANWSQAQTQAFWSNLLQQFSDFF